MKSVNNVQQYTISLHWNLKSMWHQPEQDCNQDLLKRQKVMVVFFFFLTFSDQFRMSASKETDKLIFQTTFTELIYQLQTIQNINSSTNRFKFFNDMPSTIRFFALMICLESLLSAFSSKYCGSSTVLQEQESLVLNIFKHLKSFSLMTLKFLNNFITIYINFQFLIFIDAYQSYACITKILSKKEINKKHSK